MFIFPSICTDKLEIVGRKKILMIDQSYILFVYYPRIWIIIYKKEKKRSISLKLINIFMEDLFIK